MATSNSSTETETNKPPSKTGPGSQIVVVDLGKKQRRKEIKRLRRGDGKLVDRVHGLVGELRESGELPANATLVVVVREKAKSRMRLMF